MKFAWLCSHESYQPEILVEQAVSAEAAGFDMVLGSDHFHPWVDEESAAGFVWSWFGAVAARTERIRLATSVTCPLFHYHPALIAQVYVSCGRQRLLSYIRSLRAQSEPYVRLAAQVDRTFADDADRQHEEMARLVATGDGAAMARLVRDHLQATLCRAPEILGLQRRNT